MIDYEKLLCDWLNRTQYKHLVTEVDDCLKKQGYEFKDGEITPILPKLGYSKARIATEESEDERIRKGILYLIQCVPETEWCKADVSIGEVQTWLEKQGEQKPIVIIPKFRVGDEIKTSNEESLTITKIDDKGYWSEDLFICGFDDAVKWELVEQKPAWSDEDEEMLRSITATCELAEQDRDSSLARHLLEMQLNWLKSLKDRVQLQPKREWSEEDKKIWEEISDMLWEGYKQSSSKFSWDDIRNWVNSKLKSLRPQNRWKPSDEQIKAFEHFVRSIGESGYASPYENNTKLLYSLLNDLKKL